MENDAGNTADRHPVVRSALIVEGLIKDIVVVDLQNLRFDGTSWMMSWAKALPHRPDNTQIRINFAFIGAIAFLVIMQ